MEIPWKSRLEVKPSSSSYGQRVAIVVNGMVDELVVNKLIQAEGYSPFGPNYLSFVKDEISAARSRRNPYPDYGLGAMFRSKYMVFRYILAWGFLQFYAIDPETRSLLTRFLDEFEAAYPHEYEMAIEVKKILSQQNIFESGGQTRALKEIVALWNLEEVLQVRDK